MLCSFCNVLSVMFYCFAILNSMLQLSIFVSRSSDLWSLFMCSVLSMQVAINSRMWWCLKLIWFVLLKDMNQDMSQLEPCDRLAWAFRWMSYPPIISIASFELLLKRPFPTRTFLVRKRTYKRVMIHRSTDKWDSDVWGASVPDTRWRGPRILLFTVVPLRLRAIPLQRQGRYTRDSSFRVSG